MRVLQVDSGREWRGGQNQVRLLCRELGRSSTAQPLLVTKRHSELARRAAADGVAVRGVPWWIGPDPVAAWATGAAVRAFAPAAIHAHDSHALLVAAWARRLGRLHPRPPLVATRRVDFPLRRGSPWRRADHVIAISDAVRRMLLAGGVAAERISVVPSGIDPAEVRDHARAAPLDVRERLGLAPHTPLAVNVAALVPHKDQRTLLHAAAHARGPRPDLHWVIAGDGELRAALVAERAALGLTDRVHLVGYIEPAAALIAAANVFVMSSREEGLGSVILDALALGRPVVATAGGGIPEILPAESLVPVGDAEALGRKVVQALASAPRVPLPARCTAAAMANGVLAVYRSLF